MRLCILAACISDTEIIITSIIGYVRLFQIFFLMMQRPREYTLFPYTTLFRSRSFHRDPGIPGRRRSSHAESSARSEEHTSELQSRQYLVCRLLLEKKKFSSSTRHVL